MFRNIKQNNRISYNTIPEFTIIMCCHFKIRNRGWFHHNNDDMGYIIQNVENREILNNIPSIEDLDKSIFLSG